MSLNDVVFIDSLPKLDLHGYDRETASLAINDFINDNIKLRNEIILIVHGIGTGVIRKTTHECLKNNRNVLEYKVYYYNSGCTLVRIKIDKNLH